MSSTRRHLTVRGRVQGVGFRWSCRAEAERLGVAGWVKNLPDGTVEVVVEGNEHAVQQMVDWCHRGPLPARVDLVTDSIEPVQGESIFAVR